MNSIVLGGVRSCHAERFEYKTSQIAIDVTSVFFSKFFFYLFYYYY